MMFLHIFCYQLKNLFRKKYIIGWNLLFPLVLATAFYIGFGHMVTKDPNAFQTIAAGYAEIQSVSGIPEEGTESGNAEFFLKTLEQLQTEGGKNMIDLTRYHSEKEAREALLDGQIEGYYLNEGGTLSLHIREEGVNSTILSQILKQYRSACTMAEQVAEDHPSRLLQMIAGLSVNRGYLEEYTPGRQTSPYLQFFFALLAMSSMYASWIATTMMESMCANLSECGKRFESSGAGRFPSILAGALAGTTFQIVSNAITVLYIEYVLRISFQAPFPEIMMIMGLGSAVGILFHGQFLLVRPDDGTDEAAGRECSSGSEPDQSGSRLHGQPLRTGQLREKPAVLAGCPVYGGNGDRDPVDQRSDSEEKTVCQYLKLF